MPKVSNWFNLLEDFIHCVYVGCTVDMSEVIKVK
jgi:hypothetical protein